VRDRAVLVVALPHARTVTEQLRLRKEELAL
jgi:hypothetical protein